MAEFRVPNFKPGYNPGQPIFDPGTPAGRARLGARGAVPWPWMTGYLNVHAQPTGNPAAAPVRPDAPSPSPVMANNPFSGIIAGLFKG